MHNLYNQVSFWQPTWPQNRRAHSGSLRAVVIMTAKRAKPEAIASHHLYVARQARVRNRTSTVRWLRFDPSITPRPQPSRPLILRPWLLAICDISTLMCSRFLQSILAFLLCISMFVRWGSSTSQLQSRLSKFVRSHHARLVDVFTHRFSNVGSVHPHLDLLDEFVEFVESIISLVAQHGKRLASRVVEASPIK